MEIQTAIFNFSTPGKSSICFLLSKILQNPACRDENVKHRSYFEDFTSKCLHRLYLSRDQTLSVS